MEASKFTAKERPEEGYRKVIDEGGGQVRIDAEGCADAVRLLREAVQLKGGAKAYPSVRAAVEEDGEQASPEHQEEMVMMSEFMMARQTVLFFYASVS